MHNFSHNSINTINRSRGSQVDVAINKHVGLLNLAIFAISVLIGITYIIQANRAVTKGYQIRDLEARIEQMRIDNGRLELDVAKRQSIEAIDSRVKMLGLVGSGDVVYVSTSLPTVAVNR